jgi:hypothetical protein
MALLNVEIGEQAFEPTAILRYMYISYFVLRYSEPLFVKFSLPRNFEKQTTNPKDLVSTVTTLISTIRDVPSHIVNGSN